MEWQEQELSQGQELNLQLEMFQGPLELLLHLIRAQDIDIFNIPVYQIAEEFQLYVEMMQRLDLERAGEYLAMAAELAQIKSRMLLPKVENKPEEDPRQELVERLLELEEVQQASSYLKERNQLDRDVFRRGANPCLGLPRAPLKKSPVESDSLMFVFQDMLNRRLQRLGTYHPVRREHVSVRQRILWLCSQLRQSEILRFSSLLESIQDRITMIATFLALLELGRLRRIRLRQTEDFDIQIEAVDALDDIPLRDIATFSPQETNTPEA